MAMLHVYGLPARWIVCIICTDRVPVTTDLHRAARRVDDHARGGGATLGYPAFAYRPMAASGWRMVSAGGKERRKGLIVPPNTPQLFIQYVLKPLIHIFCFTKLQELYLVKMVKVRAVAPSR